MDRTDSFLVFTVIFGLFGIGIWALLKFTGDTVGKNSPLKIPKSYQITAFQYFTKFDNLTVYYFGMIGLYCLTKIPDTFSPSVYLYDWRNPTTLIVTCIVMIGLPIYYIYLDLNYWQYTKEIKISYLPDEKVVEINFPYKTYIIRPGDIKHIEVISSSGKIQFGYSIYSLKWRIIYSHRSGTRHLGDTRIL